jgi:hypothetical protein
VISSVTAIVLSLVAASIAVGISIARFFAVAQPDEWLLCIRNGRLVIAGVGIRLWRRPGDVVARFTSTLQRVSFTASALSRERLRVSVDGFILWSVSAEGDGPFRAFQKLGLVNLDAPPRDLKSPKHLLSTPQHRAFQQLLAAAVQRLAAERSLDELLLHQGELVSAFRQHMATLERDMGIRVDQIEMLQVRPLDEDLLRQMSAELEARIREAATNIELERERALRLAQIAQEREIKLRENAALHEQELAAEHSAMEVARAVLRREELEVTARLDRIRREAEANGDAITAVAAAEERKSQNVRDHELARLVAEKVGDALQALPIHDARWITVGPDSPAASLAAMIAAARELTDGGKKAA